MYGHGDMRGVAGKRDLLDQRALFPCLDGEDDLAHGIGNELILGVVDVVEPIAAEIRPQHVAALAGGEDVFDALVDVVEVLHDVLPARERGGLPVAAARGGLGSHGLILPVRWRRVF